MTDRPMNVGLLIGRFPPDWIGGAELQVQQLATQLALRGHSATVYSRRYGGRPTRQQRDGYLIRRRSEIPVRGLRMVWDTFPAVGHIAQSRPRPEVLLCYQTLNSGLIGVVAQALLGIPAVVYIRGNNEYIIQGPSVNRILVPWIYERARSLFVQSPRMRDDLRTQLALAGKAALSGQVAAKTQIIPNGIGVPCSTRSNGTKVLYVGRLIRNKGVADLLMAAQQFPGVEVLIVGDGPDRKRLETLADGLPVNFFGQVKPSEVQEQFLQARVLVLPSHLGDGLPNVILEAMACGVPVVASHTAGIPDIVRHGETGFLFEPGETEQMAFYINRLLGDDELWQRMSEQGLCAIHPYSWDVVAPQIERALLQVVLASS